MSSILQGEIWYWSLLGLKGLRKKSTKRWTEVITLHVIKLQTYFKVKLHETIRNDYF